MLVLADEWLLQILSACVFAYLLAALTVLSRETRMLSSLTSMTFEQLPRQGCALAKGESHPGECFTVLCLIPSDDTLTDLGEGAGFRGPGLS